jgi:hypothetical protein
MWKGALCVLPLCAAISFIDEEEYAVCFRN